MRLHIFLPSAFLLFVAGSPLALRAQFQDPTPDELKMTSDPKAPGAPAVYLYREETTDNSMQVQTYYARIKVLTEKGKELASVQVPFLRSESKVDKVEGRTIHSDGTMIPLNVKPEDLVEVKSREFQVDAMAFTLPDVEVGSILEYRWRVKFKFGAPLPSWKLQSSYFIRKEHFLYDPGIVQGTLLGAITPSKAPVALKKDHGRFTVDLTDVPPVPDEDWMPPINTIRWRVEFYYMYTYAQNAKEFWEKASKWWSDYTENFVHESGAIKKAAASLVSPNDSDEQKARKIYAAVMKLDNTDYSRVKSDAERKKDKLKEIHSADDVWKDQSGAGNSMALLYVALARAAGLKVSPMEVVDRDIAIFDYSYLNLDQLDDYIAVVVIGGKDVYVDPGRKMCPFGELYWTHALAVGLRESGTSVIVALTPASTYKNNATRRTADLTIDEQGNVNGTVRLVMTGPDALYWRQQALENDQGELKKRFEESMRDDLPDGVQVDFDRFLALDDYEASLVGIVRVSGSIGAATGKRFFLPGLFFQSRAKHPFVAEDKRTVPVDVHYPKMEQDDVTYHLPPGYAVESAPHTADVTWPGYAILRIDSIAKGDSVEVARTFGHNFTLLDPENYKDLRDFYLKLAAADQQQIVLARSAATKGNSP
jgi:hypothetical protein